MTKEEYFKYGLKQKYYKHKSWLIGCFGIVTDNVYIKEELKKEINLEPDPERQAVIKTTGTFKSALVNGEYVKIDDTVVGEAILQIKGELTLNPGDLPNVKEKVVTTYGRALANAVLLTHNFHDKIDYINDKFSIGEIESNIASRLEDDIPKEQRDPKNKTKIYVDEYINFVDACLYLTGLCQLAVHAGSEISIAPPPGITEFKQKLLKKYEGKLNDPISLVAFETELKEFDKEFIKNDPGYGVFLSGKQVNINRKKMFLNLGVDGSFDSMDKVNPVINSLEEGWPRDPQQFTNMMNGMRVGTYGRGKGTIKGGVLQKVVFRASNNFVIVDEDCGSDKGITYKLTPGNIKSKVGRIAKLKGSWVHIDNIEMLKPYIDTDVMFRSPMYCRCQGDRICKVCAGDKLSINKRGIATVLSDFTWVILQKELDKMHGKVLKTSKLKLKDLIT